MSSNMPLTELLELLQKRADELEAIHGDAEPNGMRGMRVMVHNRKQREWMMAGHPTLEQHLPRIGRVTKQKGGDA